MKELVVLGFASRELAEEARSVGAELDRKGVLQLDGAALAYRRDDGRVELVRPMRLAPVAPLAGLRPVGCWGCCWSPYSSPPSAPSPEPLAPGCPRSGSVEVDETYTAGTIPAVHPTTQHQRRKPGLASPPPSHPHRCTGPGRHRSLVAAPLGAVSARYG